MEWKDANYCTTLDFNMVMQSVSGIITNVTDKNKRDSLNIFTSVNLSVFDLGQIIFVLLTHYLKL
jgi:hypothetical protein